MSEKHLGFSAGSSMSIVLTLYGPEYVCNLPKTGNLSRKLCGGRALGFLRSSSGAWLRSEGSCPFGCPRTTSGKTELKGMMKALRLLSLVSIQTLSRRNRSKDHSLHHNREGCHSREVRIQRNVELLSQLPSFLAASSTYIWVHSLSAHMGVENGCKQKEQQTRRLQQLSFRKRKKSEGLTVLPTPANGAPSSIRFGKGEPLTALSGGCDSCFACLFAPSSATFAVYIAMQLFNWAKYLLSMTNRTPGVDLISTAILNICTTSRPPAHATSYSCPPLGRLVKPQ